ncbi:TPA: hypothetical protein DIV45_02985 [Patescibacteria group bacterium]|nr:hypothetical protein [Patescibacteria group bacterium]
MINLNIKIDILEEMIDMEKQLKEFIEAVNKLPFKIPVVLADEINSRMEEIGGVNVIGTRELMPTLGGTLCISTGGNPVSSVKNVMDIIEKLIGKKPVVRNFSVSMGISVVPSWLKAKVTLSIADGVFGRYCLNDPNLGWVVIEALRQELGEPVDGCWSYSVYYVWPS